MSPRRLGGWEPIEEQIVERDDDGRVVRVVTVRESEFSPEDVAALRSLMELQEVKGPHGIPMDEATDPANRNAFHAEFRVDHAQAAIDRRRDQMRKTFQDDPGYGWTFWASRGAASAQKPRA